jgi:hypothetical protein
MFKNNFILLGNFKNDNEQFSTFEIINNNKINNENISKLLALISLIAIFYFLSGYTYFDEENNLKLTDYGSIMKNYSLYPLYKFDKITLVINGIINWKIKESSLLNFIDNLNKQTLEELQIIFFIPKDNKYDFIKKMITKNKKMKIFSPSQNLESDTFHLMNIIKGKFVMYIEKLVMFDNDELEKFFFLTNGKIDNNFEYQIKNKTFQLIKTKTLRKLIDDGQLFENYTTLLNNIISLPKPELNYILPGYFSEVMINLLTHHPHETYKYIYTKRKKVLKKILFRSYQKSFATLSQKLFNLETLNYAVLID